MSRKSPPQFALASTVTTQSLLSFLWTLRGQLPIVAGFFKALDCAGVLEWPTEEEENECTSS